MKNVILAATLFAAASSAVASIPVSASAEAIPVSATAEAIPVSATAEAIPVSAKAEAEAPYVAAKGFPVSSPVSAPQAAEEGEGSIALAGLGFGLVGLIGVGKMARRKKAKADDIRP